MGSMKSQFKKADASGARFALIFGQAELESGDVAIKPLRGPRTEADVGEPAQQLLKPLAEAAHWASDLRLP
jgi:histidyl-tRNA synthetase